MEQEKLKQETLERPKDNIRNFVPNTMFKAWVDANLVHPQQGLGIISAVGAEFYDGKRSIEERMQARLSEAQMKLVLRRMYTAHKAHGIVPEVPIATLEKKTTTLWQGLGVSALLVGLRYVHVVLGEENPQADLLFDKKDAREQGATRLDTIFEERPELQKEIAYIFKLAEEGCKQKEVRDLEKQRRKLFSQKGITEQETKENREVALGLVKTIQDQVFNYILEKSKGEQLNIDLSTKERVAELFDNK